MKLKKLLTITLGIGSCLCLLSCGDNKEKESSSESKTESSTIVESSKEEIQSSSTNNQESSLNTESSETVESQNETSSLIESGSAVSDEWTLITLEELSSHIENLETAPYNFAIVKSSDHENSYAIKIENGKIYRSDYFGNDIYNYEFEWKANPLNDCPNLTLDNVTKNMIPSNLTKLDNGYYEVTVEGQKALLSIEKNKNNYINYKILNPTNLSEFWHNNYGLIIEDNELQYTWDTVDLTKVNGHIVENSENDKK